MSYHNAFLHRPWCSATEHHEFNGHFGDVLARCRECRAVGIAPSQYAHGVAEPQYKPNSPDARLEQIVGQPAPVAPIAPALRRLCPDCTQRPARDQRPQARDGRCVTCRDEAHNPRRKSA